MQNDLKSISIMFDLLPPSISLRPYQFELLTQLGPIFFDHTELKQEELNHWYQIQKPSFKKSVDSFLELSLTQKTLAYYNYRRIYYPTTYLIPVISSATAISIGIIKIFKNAMLLKRISYSVLSGLVASLVSNLCELTYYSAKMNTYSSRLEIARQKIQG